MANWGKILSRGNVEDRRGSAVGIGGGLGLGGVALLLLFNYFAGGDITDVLTRIDPAQVANPSSYSAEYEGEDPYESFASAVLGSNNETWEGLLAARGIDYAPPRLVLFRSATQSGCGIANAEVGPHYCPADGTIYLDETFFDELTRRFGAQGGDVAEAYVISHEVAHHVQSILGAMEASGRTNEDSIRLELQADCYAGLWAHSIRDLGVFEPGEIGEAIDAARAVGDDRIQQSTTGRVNPESWTHGSSADRVRWFNRGAEIGTVEACDTFE